jgi:hypothetical protein
MGMLRVVCFHVQSSKGGSPRLSRLWTDRLAPVSKFNYILTHTGFMGFHKLCSFEGCQVERYPTIPPRCTSGGPPTDAHRGIA